MIDTAHQIKKCLDVAYLTHNPQAAYEFFQQHWQAQFEANDRIVLYSSHDWPDDLIKHLYAAAALIDISNCFIMLVGPNIGQRQVQQFSNGVSFEVLVTNAINDSLPLSTQYQLSTSICPLPWMHLEVKNQGEISPCCISSKHLGNVADGGIQSIFNSTDLKNFRQQFLQGQRPGECNACWKLEDRGLTSNRQRHLSFLKKDLLTKYLSRPTIASLDLKPGNTCNFKCRICGPRASSQFAQEQAAFNAGTEIQSYNWAESTETVINEVKQLLPNIENLDLYGGEPFLIKPLTELVEHAVQSGAAPQIRLHYNSNGSVFPDRLLPYWSHFKHIDIHFSIDNVGKRFELERGGSWSQVENNIKKLVDLDLPNMKISVMPVISIMNIYYLDELMAWCQVLGLPINPLYLENPRPFAISNLTEDAKNLIIEKFASHAWPEMQRILNFIRKQPGSTGESFVQLTRHFDQLRNQDFLITHKEIATAMKMC